MDVRAIRSYGQMRGLHLRYEDYFLLNLERHLELLVASHFLSSEEAGRINQVIAANRCVLELGQACLVHKDMALWNILGTKDSIAAFIDWDDCIGGDPTDDLSLLACFHEPHVVAEAVVGYRTVRPLPDQFMTRFWMHLLRNMLVKAVIRVGAGYFNRTDDFYLINSGGTGKDFSVFTHQRLLSAITALEEQREELTYE